MHAQVMLEAVADAILTQQARPSFDQDCLCMFCVVEAGSLACSSQESIEQHLLDWHRSYWKSSGLLDSNAADRSYRLAHVQA